MVNYQRRGKLTRRERVPYWGRSFLLLCLLIYLIFISDPANNHSYADMLHNTHWSYPDILHDMHCRVSQTPQWVFSVSVHLLSLLFLQVSLHKEKYQFSTWSPWEHKVWNPPHISGSTWLSGLCHLYNLCHSYWRTKSFLHDLRRK